MLYYHVSNFHNITPIYSLFQGNRVQATVRTKELINKFRLLIDEGSCYRVSNFGVGENGGRYPFLNHKFKIAFFRNTAVTRVVGWDKNIHGFKFEPFTNFQTKKFKESYVVGEFLFFICLIYHFKSIFCIYILSMDCNSIFYMQM